MRKKGLLDPVDAVIDPSFTKEVLEYSNSEKLKPSAIDPFHDQKNPLIMFRHFNPIYNASVPQMPLCTKPSLSPST